MWVLFWWHRHALCLFHLFQLAGVLGGASGSIKRAQSCRCTYGTSQGWHTSLCLCVCQCVFAGVTLSQRVASVAADSTWEWYRQRHTITHDVINSLLPHLTCFHTSTLTHSLLYKLPSSVSLSTVHEGCVCVSIHLGLAGFTAVVPVLHSALHADKN